MYTNDVDVSIGSGWEMSHERYKFKPGEYITNGYLSGIGKGQRLGKIFFQTSTGEEFLAGSGDAKAYDFGDIGYVKSFPPSSPSSWR